MVTALENCEYPVLGKYAQKMPDELSLNPGDIVHIIKKAERGWAKGRNLTTQQVDLFPITTHNDGWAKGHTMT